MDLQITIRTESNVTVLQACGYIDGKTAPDFQGEILQIMQEANTILIDLAQVGFMSSAGLRAMLVTHQQAQQGEAKVVALAGLSESIRDNMNATGFLSFFQVFETVEDGLKKLV